jgi:glycosyltransferase involved in cell wall biosynthesis
LCTVSIIVRTNNRSLLLRRAIKSIMEQTYSDWELIVVNNGGSSKDLDETVRDYMACLNPKMKILHLDKANYMEVATNAGIRISTGRYITLLDDDDTWDSTFLQKCISILNTPSIYAVASQSTLIYETITENIIKQAGIEKFNPNFTRVKLSKLARCNLFTTNSLIYKREVLDKIGLYREDLPVLGDWEFNLRLALKFEIHVIPESLAYYHKRIQFDNLTSYSNTQIRDHLYYDKKIRNEYVIKGFRGGNSAYFGMLIYGFLYVNKLLKILTKILKAR